MTHPRDHKPYDYKNLHVLAKLVDDAIVWYPSEEWQLPHMTCRDMTCLVVVPVGDDDRVAIVFRGPVTSRGIEGYKCDGEGQNVSSLLHAAAEIMKP